ncbi:MAG TPA: NADH-quinone oxidoreductase subunit NuoE [Actinopolymorphaceae bacterium]|jgi:NADH-quinone oxidoreductase subunit E
MHVNGASRPAVAEQSSRLSDKTMAELREIMARYPQKRSALLPMLHLVQSEEGYVSTAGIEACAELLDLTPAEVAAVATFYTMFKRRPVGDYHVGVCTNTLCAVMGGDEIFATLKEHLGIGNDETTPDGKITLEHVECNAACDYAPVVMVNWEFFDNMTPERARRLVDDLRAGVEVRADRGARVCTWRQAERVLAGFLDDRADEGPSAGEASLAGLKLAHDRDWKAPTGGDGGAPEMTTRPATPTEATKTAAEADTKRAESESRAAEVDAGEGDKPASPGDSGTSGGNA